MENCSDVKLIVLLRANDMQAFDTLYFKYHSAIYRNILKLVKDDETAENILQEVFMQLWEKRLTLDENRNIPGWLFTVSYNKSIDYLKRAAKENLFINELEKISVEEDNDAVVKEYRLRLLEDAMARLSPQKKSVLMMCKLQGRSYEETARELNISKHTVKEYLTLAVRSVKDHMLSDPYGKFLTFLIFFLCVL